MSTLAHLVEQRLMADVEHRKEMFTSRIKQLIMSGAGREAIIRDILQRWLSKALETFWKAQEKDLFLILLEEFGSESEYKPEDLRLNFVVEELVKEVMNVVQLVIR